MTLRIMALWLFRLELGSSTFPMTLLANWLEPLLGCPSVSSGGKIFVLSLFLHTQLSLWFSLQTSLHSALNTNVTTYVHTWIEAAASIQ